MEKQSLKRRYINLTGGEDTERDCSENEVLDDDIYEDEDIYDDEDLEAMYDDGYDEIPVTEVFKEAQRKRRKEIMDNIKVTATLAGILALGIGAVILIGRIIMIPIVKSVAKELDL